jgi:hypothetical protein
MPLIAYISHDFPSSAGPGATSASGLYKVTWAELIHSGITVGRANWFDVVRDGRYSFFEIVYRAAILYANLKSDSDNAWLKKTSAYRQLDPSEKSAVSYFLGLTFAKLTADHFLETPWLMHLDAYRRHFQIGPGIGKVRPDLFGESLAREWIVVEAKGRTGRFDLKAFQSAKKQTGGIGQINGKFPVTRAAVEVFFERDRLSLRIEDPPDHDESAPKLEISEPGLLRSYYEPFIALTDWSPVRTDTFAGVAFTIIDIDLADFAIGIANDTLEPLREIRSQPPEAMPTEDGLRASVFETLRRVQAVERIALPPQSALGRDGIIIFLGPTWSALSMAREPFDRRR